MAMDAGGEVKTVDRSGLLTALEKINGITSNAQLEIEAEQELIDIQTANANEIFRIRMDLLNKEKKAEIEVQHAARKAYEENAKQRQKTIDAEIKKREKAAKKPLSPEEKKQIEAKYKFEGEIEERYRKKALKAQQEADKKRAREAGELWFKEQNSILFGKGQGIGARFGALKELMTSDKGDGRASFDTRKAFLTMTKTLSNFTQKLDAKIDVIAATRSAIDTRLQGSNNNRTNGPLGSYWDQMSRDITGMAGMSPFFKQETIINNLKTLVGQGISYNVEQRAFLSTIKDKIATTFNVADSTLLRLVRIQQEDTTAGRLGMESALNTFLNSMYETTEYMESIMSGVKANLEESMALMSGEGAAAFEYQVQKWMGSLYSVGMSQSAVTGIASALGQLAAGDINNLVGSNFGNLLLMSANNSGGKGISDILASGLDASETNTLIQSMVNYLAQIYNETAGNHVIQQQLANIYGIKASDLRAASNLADNTTMKAITGNNLTYGSGINQLFAMANSMWSRTSLGEMNSNLWENIQYSSAAGIANNPTLYGIFKVAGLLDNLVGGMPLPFINTAFGGVDLHTTTADLMRSGAFAGGILNSLAAIISGGGGGAVPSSTLKALGITSKANVVTRGSAPVYGGGAGISESGSITPGNSSGADIQSATLSQAANEKNAQMASAQENINETKLSTVDEHILQIYSILQEVVDGTSSLTVRTALDQGFGWSK